MSSIVHTRVAATARAPINIETGCTYIVRLIGVAAAKLPDSDETEIRNASALLRAATTLVQSSEARLQMAAVITAPRNRQGGATPSEAAALRADALHVCTLLELASIEIGSLPDLDDVDALVLSVKGLAESWADEIARQLSDGTPAK